MTGSSDPVTAEAIHALDARTIEHIAAGEVVERPASVVKELLENSLDAGASRIEVAVQNGGIDGIRVVDDGVGMSDRAVQKAIEPHTTSKLREIDDLYRGVDTLGFRGEALNSIAAVSRLTITTRPHDGPDAGTELRVAGGNIESVDPAGCPPGTTVEVRDLFYNTPARRAFLRAPSTEFDHVNRLVAHYALANAQVAMTLRHDDREVFNTSGRGDLTGTVLAVYGREVAESMIDVEAGFDDGQLSHVSGLVSHPETTRSRPRYISTFVNDRYVRSPTLRNGILRAYGGQLATDRFPFAVLFCSLSAETVDVNVHPRKLEVRFEDADAVAERVEGAVSDALLSSGLIRKTAPRGAGSPQETVLPTDPDSAAERRRDVSTDPTRSRIAGPDRRARGHDPVRAGSTDDAPEHAESVERADPDGATRERLVADDRPFRDRTGQATIEGETPSPTLSKLPRLTILGQHNDTFIVAETSDSLILIDQHAADERITYERLRKAVDGRASRQALVTPVTVSLTSDEVTAFTHVRETLEEVGFDAELQEEDTLLVTGIPTVLDATIEPERIRDAVGSALEHVEVARPIDTLTDSLLADMACHPAVTGNTRLTEGSIIALLEALDDCDNPYECPHGRPVIVRIDETELAERFERDYPGHGERRPES